MLGLGLSLGIIAGFIGATLFADRRHMAELTRLGNMLSVHSPELRPAVTIPATADPVTVALARVNSEATRRGAAAIKEEYERRGIPISEQEATMQAKAAVSGNREFGVRVSG
ncbi:MAG: hypothetical protein H0W63_03925 [Gemmatimonadaceae bacterium]|nr:hypothetical protein [Gemmatimonadaceae bacterium]